MPAVSRKSSNGSARSKVTNGALFAWDGDGRTREARRFRDILVQVIDDMGGADRLSEAQRQLARRHALLSVECERIGHAVIIEGAPLDATAYIARASEQRRLAMCLGVEREAKPIGPAPKTLDAYL